MNWGPTTTIIVCAVGIPVVVTTFVCLLGWTMAHADRKYRSEVHPGSVRLTRFDEEFLRSHSIDTDDAVTVSRRNHPSNWGQS